MSLASVSLRQEEAGGGVSRFLSTKKGQPSSSPLGWYHSPVKEASGNAISSQKLEGAVGIYGQCRGC